MKIVINALSARLGGGQTYLKNLLAHLPEEPDLDILVYAPSSLRLPEGHRIRRGETAWPTENPLLRSVWEKLALPFILARERADVLFCPGGVIVSRVPEGCKTVTMFRNMMPFDREVLKRMPFGLQRIRNWLLRPLMLKSMANADLTIFISDHARNVIESMIKVKKAVTVPHGINDAFRTHGKQLARPENVGPGPYILYVSRFDIYKHHWEVVSGYSKLPEHLRNQYRLLLAGECETPEANRVKALVNQLGLQEQVRILGPIPYGELPALYRNAHLVLFASSCENCPNILLEALGSGRPVLSSDVMPMPEFGGDAADYFSPFKPDEVTRSIMKVLEDLAYANQLAASAAARSGKYDWSVTADTTWKCISGLVGYENIDC